MLKELAEVLVCIASFISGDYLDEQPNEWYTRCNSVIEDSSVCHEEMTEEEYNTQWQKQVEMREEQKRVEEQQYQQQLRQLRQEINVDDVQTIIDYIDFNTEIPNMESLARLLNGTYSYESTLYGADGNKNRQYVEVNDLHISLIRGKNGDVHLTVLDDMHGIYSRTWEY